MTSSPTSSCYSSYQSPFSSSSSNFPVLPITAMKSKIVEKIQENRVTLIVGETGCGKSSQVPQFLLEEGMHPILCTQPRRFAVVAVARMVAKARSCEVGGEVGYHIGRSRVFSARSKIVFKTAGVLLDEMRERGLNALKYKVIILDEVHERSVESDLVLVCVKQFLKKNSDLRVVLMSATADISRYREYFRDLGRDERVEVLAIPSTGQHTIFQRQVSYLEQVSELVGMGSENLSLNYSAKPSPFMEEADIKLEVHTLIHRLIIHIHKTEPDIEKSILVFLPTYYSLEQQWLLLKRYDQSFKVHVLHSSIDTEQALKAMKIWKSHRKVILATNIAESSVTIPKVGYVIDSCRSLQVFWDSKRRAESAELVWCSKSQADQRKGRTGRTCDGQVYRMVTGSFYNQLPDYEPPAILRLALRLQVLVLCCAESKAINDPRVLLRKALDPPDPEVVDDALNLLVHIHALQKTSLRGRYEPTLYGRLVSSFSLSFDASVLLLKFGEMGMLREGILIGILMDIQPLPIMRPFGQEALFMEYIDNYYHGDSRITGLTGRKEVTYMGNLCAFHFWQHALRDKFRLQRLKHLLKFDETDGTELLLPKIEDEWCSFHNLVQSALHQVGEAYYEILDTLHRFRPKFLATSNGLPCYSNPYEFRHSCHLVYEENGDTYALSVDDQLEPDNEKKCAEVPFVPPDDLLANTVAKKLAAIIKEMRTQYAEELSGDDKKFTNDGVSIISESPLCKFFLNGFCNRGSDCYFSHSLQSKRPTCKFFFSLQGCRNGDSCFFSHDSVPSASSGGSSTLCSPEDEEADAESLLELLPSPFEGCILILDDVDFHFSSHLARYREPSTIICTTFQLEGSTSDPPPADVQILWGLSHPSKTIMPSRGKTAIAWNAVKCALWFPRFDSEYSEGQKNQIQTLFEYLAILILADSLHQLRVIITMNNLQFSHFQVEKLARENFFFLEQSFPFDELSLGKLYDHVTTTKPMLVSRAVSYVFTMNPPANIHSSDCTTALCQRLQNVSF